MTILFIMYVLLAQEPQEVSVGETQWVTPDIELGRFNARDVTIGELLRRVTEDRAINVVVDQSITQKMTLQMHATTLNALLNLLVTTQGVEVKVLNNIIYVSRPAPAPPPEPVNDIVYDEVADTISFDLSSLTADQFARKLTELTGRNVLLRNRGLRANFKGYQAALPLDQGVRLLIEANGMALEEEDGVWFIAPPPAPEPVAVEDGEQKPQIEPERTVPGIQFDGDLFSVRFVDKPIKEIFTSLADTGKISMAVHGTPDQAVSIDVRDVDVDQIFSLLLAGSDYGYVVENGVYIVGSKEKTSLRETRIVSLEFLNAEMVEQNMPESLKDGTSVTIVKELNSLLVSGERSKVLDMAALIRELDRPVPQVLIEVVVVDYNFTDDREFGVSLTNGDNTIIPGLDVTLDGFRDENGDWRVRKLPSNFGLRLRAMEENGQARIISKPHVAALNGHEASIKIGSKQFYRLQSEELVGDQAPRVRTSQEIREIEANILLKITPWVSGNGEVTTLIEPSFTNFLGTINDNIPPPISSRELSSTVRLKDGETIILGGLIEKVDNIDTKGVPGLSRIPLLGALFRERNREKRQSELVIYITPHVYYGDEGSVEFIEEREGLEYQLDVKKQKQGIKAETPLRRPWYKRIFRKKKKPTPDPFEELENVESPKSNQ